jgi:hypothetical protein
VPTQKFNVSICITTNTSVFLKGSLLTKNATFRACISSWDEFFYSLLTSACVISHRIKTVSTLRLSLNSLQPRFYVCTVNKLQTPHYNFFRYNHSRCKSCSYQIIRQANLSPDRLYLNLLKPSGNFTYRQV